MLEPGRSAKHFVAPAVERGDPISQIHNCGAIAVVRCFPF
jgi:hypothetical protein